MSLFWLFLVTASFFLGATKLTFWILVYLAVANIFAIFKVARNPESFFDAESNYMLNKGKFDVAVGERSLLGVFIVKLILIVIWTTLAMLLFFKYDLNF